MIPLSTTTVTVSEPAAADAYADPYGTPGERVTTRSGVRAVIDLPTGRQDVEAGGQSVWQFELICDPVAISRLARVTDDSAGVDYDVVWVMTYPDHVEAGLRYIQGVV